MTTSSENRTNGIKWYIGIVLIASFIYAGIYYLAFPERDRLSYTIMAIIYMFFPFLSALLVDKLILKRKAFKGWSLNFNPNWWFLAAWPAVVVLAFLVLAISIAWPDLSFSPDMSGFWERMAQHVSPDQIEMQKAQIESMKVPFILVTIGQALLAGITINAFAAFGEETGWRGFMVREYKNLKFWNAALRIGIIWGIWHSPLILMGHNYPEHNLIGVGMMTAWCVLLSPLFLYVRIKTHSTIAASIMHGTLNASAGIPLMYVAGGNDLTVGFTGFPGFVALSLAIVLIILYDTILSKHPVTQVTILEGIKQKKAVQ